MRARRWAPVLALGVLLEAAVLVGCGGGGVSSAKLQAQDNFVSEVHAAAPLIGSYRSDVQLVRLGNAACDGFRSGASYQVIADRLTLNEGRKPLPPDALGAVMTSAVSALCPEYHGRL